MNGLALVHRGTEDITAHELQQLGATHVLPNDACVQFTVPALNDLCRITYQTRTASAILWVLGTITQLETLDLSFATGKTFAVQGPDAPAIGARIAEKTHNKVSLTNPDIIFVNHQNTLCIDLTGTDLGKRDYRIFLGPTSIKGTLAYSLLAIAGWTPQKNLLDPFCQAGIIIIEAALAARQKPIAHHYKNTLAFHKLLDIDLSPIDNAILPEKTLPIHAFDPHFKHISATQKNAKIAHVNKCITTSRQDIDWLDIKLQKNSIDCIVTALPPEKDLKKNDIQTLFTRAKPILKKTGTITILTKTKQQDILAAAKDYTLKEQRTLWQGQASLSVFVFVREQ